MSAPGYSGTPLPRKLGISEGTRLCPIGAPDDYLALLGPLPPGVQVQRRVGAGTAIVHLFSTERVDLEARLAKLRNRIDPAAAVWVSWPKKSSGVTTTVTEDVIRAVALPLGFVDVKVCAVSDMWSALKLVIRKELRPAAPRRAR